MRLHVDTSFLIDWYANDPAALVLAQEMTGGIHAVSVDAIAETEYFAATRVDIDRVLLYDSLLQFARRIDMTPRASRLAAGWLAPMNEPKRRAHFADALIAAIATTEDALLVTRDTRIDVVLPVKVLRY